MRIKFFYQLLISHISILILAFLILSISFSQFVERYIFQNKVEELEGYGDQILTDLIVRMEGDEQFLSEYSQLLNTRHIKYILFNYEGKVIYPKLQSSQLIQLTEAEWSEISKGNKV